jgi:hypothetical protein
MALDQSRAVRRGAGTLQANLTLRHFGDGDDAKRRSRLADKDVSEVEQVVILESRDRGFDVIETFQSARSGISAPFGPFVLHRRRVAGG